MYFSVDLSYLSSLESRKKKKQNNTLILSILIYICHFMVTDVDKKDEWWVEVLTYTQENISSEKQYMLPLKALLR